MHSTGIKFVINYGSGYVPNYVWYKHESHWALGHVNAYLADYAFTDTNAKYVASYGWYGSYQMGNCIGYIDQCNEPCEWITCDQSQDMVINGEVAISVYNQNGQTGADALEVCYYD